MDLVYEGEHCYDGERCIHCGVNIYDEGIYGPSPCAPHEPVTYTTETPKRFV